MAGRGLGGKRGSGTALMIPGTTMAPRPRQRPCNTNDSDAKLDSFLEVSVFFVLDVYSCKCVINKGAYLYHKQRMHQWRGGDWEESVGLEQH